MKNSIKRMAVWFYFGSGTNRMEYLLNLICQERGWFVSNGRYNANKYI